MPFRTSSYENIHVLVCIFCMLSELNILPSTNTVSDFTVYIITEIFYTTNMQMIYVVMEYNTACEWIPQ